MEDNHTPEEESIPDEIPDFKSFQTPRQTPIKEINSFLDLFIPSEGYFIAPILIDLNILIFIIMMLSGVNILDPDIVTLQKWGADFRPLTLEGQWWRLLTNCFIHKGIFHLISNLSVLIYIGLLLEPLIGRARFLAAYLLTGLVASLASLGFHELTTSAGASGAILGICGVLLSLLLTNLVERKKVLLITLSLGVGVNLISGILPHVDFSAHFAGVISGLIIGFSFLPGLRKPDDVHLKYAPIGISTFIILAISITAYALLPSNMELYKNKMRFFTMPWERNYDLIKNYDKAHPSAIDEYIQVKGASGDKKLNYYLKRGIYNWDERKKLMTKVEISDPSGDMNTYHEKMKHFISTEGMALDVYGLTGSIPKDKLLYSLKERGIYYWNVNLTTINEIDQLRLPKVILDRNSKLRQYCELRVKCYELMCKVIENKNDTDKTLIDYYNRQIETLINELKDKKEIN